MAATTVIYLLHFTPAYTAPIGDTGRTKTAGHYLGSTALGAEARLAEHVSGRGSPLVKAAVAQGCAVDLVATFPGGRADERRLKRSRHHHRLCPICSNGPAPMRAA